MCQSRAFAGVVALLGRGHPAFDKRTGTKAVATLVSRLDAGSLGNVLKEVRRSHCAASCTPL